MSGRSGPSLLPQVLLCGGLSVALGLIMRGMDPATVGHAYWQWPVLAGVAVLVGVPVVCWQGRGGSASTIGRWAGRSRRNAGVASRWSILCSASRFAMRRRARIMRPRALGWMPWWQLIRVNVTEFATPVARVGMWRVWSPIEDVTLRIGGPRTGKTGELACRLLDAPGPVIATSTRMDLLELTGPCRERSGPVHVFNPSGIGGRESTITFDPLAGCADPVVAVARATDLVSGGSSDRSGAEREFWDDHARRVLALLLHAAALGGGSMRDVLAWVSNPDDAAATVSLFLRRATAPEWELDAAQFVATNDRTRSSICSTIMPALGWLRQPTAAAAASHDGAGFDVEALLRSRGTVYMLGAEDASTAPLLAALTGHIAREARRIAATCEGGRLDPPLTLALDEAALICPIPLDNWTADMGGRGVTIHIACQSRAQLRKRWGADGAAAILNNAATLMLFGGTRDPEDLQAFSTLTGERDESVPTMGPNGELTGHTIRRVPVLSPGHLAQLPAGRVVVFRRGMAPMVGRVEMAWQRREVRHFERHQRRIDRTIELENAKVEAFEWFLSLGRAVRARVSEQITALQLRREVERLLGPVSGRPKSQDPADSLSQHEVDAEFGRLIGDPSRFTSPGKDDSGNKSRGDAGPDGAP